MSQSLSAVFMHLVFSTKHRHPFLNDKSLRESTHAYLGEISKRLECPPIMIGGVEDHVHVLAKMGRNAHTKNWIKELKRLSHIWLEQQSPMLRKFDWQDGYGLFSVSATHVDIVSHYIRNQEEHHRKVGFQDEFRRLLTVHKVEWDERYVWD